MTSTDLDLSADIIDVRDIIARVEDLRDECDDTSALNTPEARQDLKDLESLLEDLQGLGGDEQFEGEWYPVTLIRDSYFTAYAQELAEDIGAVDANAKWPNNCIDWEFAAKELKYDYSGVDINGTTYWTR